MQNPSSGPRKAAVVFVFITIMLDVIALGVVIPVLPKLIVQFMGGDTGNGARVFGLFGTIWALMHFIWSPALGALSDRFGRRPVILLSNLGLGLDYLFMAVAPTLGWLFVGRVISGITSASIPTAYAYIADVTPPEKRAAGFGMLGAAFGIGFVLGPAIGGLLGGLDPRLPFWVAAALSLLNAAYGALILPESLPVERRHRFEWRRANPFGSLVLLRSQPRLFGLACVNFLSFVAHDVLPSTFVLYVAYRYLWGEQAVGLCLAAVGICSAVVQGGLIGPIVKRFGERNTLVVGMLIGALGFAVHGLASGGTFFLLGLPLVALWGMAGPASQSLMSRLVSPTEQGLLQGSNSCLRGIAEMIGPGLFTFTFATFIRSDIGWQVPGAAFLLAAVLLTASGILAWVVTRPEQTAVITISGAQSNTSP